MALPSNFATPPGEDANHYFRNVCIEFEKTIRETENRKQLEMEMQRFIEIAKQMDWQHKTSGVYHKDEGEKAVDKVWKEFQRYIHQLRKHSPGAHKQDLLDALAAVKQLILNKKVL